MEKDLIVLISDYPYNKGEPFFENEMRMLSKTFDRIFLFSVVGKKKEKPTRSFPENVYCYPLGIGHNRIKHILRGFFSSDNFFKLKGKSGPKLLTSAYMLGRNTVIFKMIKKVLSKQDFSNSNVIVYSYWLTLGISLVKTRNFLVQRLNRQIRTISRCHGYDIYSEINKYNYQPFQYEVIDLVDNIYPCSKYGQNYLSKKYPKFEGKIIVSYLSSDDNGIEEFRFNHNKTKHFVTVAGFRPVKRLDLFARAFVKLTKNNCDVHWDAIGDGEEFEKIKKYVDDEGVSDKVSFYGSKMNSEVFQFYKTKEVFFFVNVSSSEGLPVSVMEATSFGIPVLATNVGGTSELVDESNGLLVDKDIDENELAIKLADLCSIKEKKYNDLRRCSRDKWEANFNSTKNLSLWIDEIIK